MRELIHDINSVEFRIGFDRFDRSGLLRGDVEDQNEKEGDDGEREKESFSEVVSVSRGFEERLRRRRIRKSHGRREI